jgi:ATP-dependent Lhr-like helicase
VSVVGFHPVVEQWFAETLGEPTAAQRLGWRAIRSGRPTLIAAPTGSGKTLAAFLTALDDLVREGLTAPLPDEVRVVYVSPLKALSADIHKNLAEPRRGIRRVAEMLGVDAPKITAAVRTGDTPASARAAMLRTPPHILVTTPESLYLLLTAERSRRMLRTARTVIVDEIHAVIGTRRGAHLALSLERLQEMAEQPILRLGLSATQNPVEEVAQYLIGATAPLDSCAVVDEGHRRRMDLALEVPRSPLDAVMSHEVWEEYYDRLAALVAEHHTTLVFVNTRKMAERVARHLSDRLGEDAVTAHHGSLSKEKRLDAETRLKAGALKALVATASLELGIDIGAVDLVCQIGSPHRIATFLQRVGRSGHTIAGLPKGRLFPESRDDLVECAALLRAVGRGALDRIVHHDAPLDVLAQQIVAETACREYGEDELYAFVRRAWPYHALARADFDAVLTMVAEGFATRRGRRAALVHRDEVNRLVRGRRGSRLLAIIAGGAIPEVADYRVLLDPGETFIGTLNEDFAIESMAGDIFQLGNASWQILQVGAGVVRVADAKGAPPTIPFWLGEAPGRSDELSRAVSDLCADVEVRLKADTTCTDDTVRLKADTTYEAAATDRDADMAHDSTGTGQDVVSAFRRTSETATVESGSGRADVVSGCSRTVEWLVAETGLSTAAAEQAVAYLDAGRRVLGALPTQDTLVLERFFDESGGMQLVLHAPFGSRINKAWGLALRKRFCRQFNFELQASATEDALLLSLGPQHSFPLTDVFRYLHPATARDVLVQAFLDAPVFQTRWRWNATISLAVPRNRNGRKVAPQLQRMQADDLMAACFPDAAACLENIPGDRQIPDHPLVSQTVRDCLEEAMDFDGLAAVLERIHRGQVRCLAVDTPEPSTLSYAILNAKPYAFLDDAPLEERRTQAVYTRRAGEGGEHGALDVAAIERVRDEERPAPRDADELHDVLLTAGFLTDAEAAAIDRALFDQLAAAGRATTVSNLQFAISNLQFLWVSAERLPEMRAILPALTAEPDVQPPPSRAAREWTRDTALVEILRSRMAILGPTTAAALAASLSIAPSDVDAALLALEADGAVLRGAFEGRDAVEWCDRRLLARIHRYTLNRLRADIEPVSPADFMRFLFVWQHAAPAERLTGIDGLREVIELLNGFEAPAAAWERTILPARLDPYDASLLDTLCLTGEVAWARASAPAVAATDPSAIVASTPIALFPRAHAASWIAPAGDGVAEIGPGDPALQAVVQMLRTRGASFSHEIAAACNLGDEALYATLARLVGAGLITSDGFGGLRALLRMDAGRARGRAHVAGRWSIVQASHEADLAAVAEAQAHVLLRRYGVVFRRLLTREPGAVGWRDLTRVYRRLEARGEIRGGRFVSGMSGEQFALPEAVERLREVRRTEPDGRLIPISAADSLNLVGIVTAGDRIRALAASRILYRDGVPLAAMEGDYLKPLADVPVEVAGQVATALAGRAVPPVLSGYVGRSC